MSTGSRASHSDQVVGTIPSLTTLRFIFALIVIWTHINMITLGLQLAGGDLRFEDSWLEGRMGVVFFFVLSGFILSCVYYSTMRDMTATRVATFYVNRIARIFPVHWLTLLVTVALSFAYFERVGNSLSTTLDVVGVDAYSGNWAHRLVDLISNITLTQSLVPYGIEPLEYNGVAWSLSAELFFYALFPFMMFVFLRIFRCRGIHVILGSLAIIALHMVRMSTLIDNSVIAERLYTYPPFRFVEFMLGVGIGMLFVERHTARRRSSNTFVWTLLEAATIAIIVGLFFLAIAKIPVVYRITGWYAPAMALMIYVFAHENGLITRLLSLRVGFLAGELAFGMYMWHLPVLVSLFLWYDLALVQLTIATVTVTICLSAVTYRYFEIPMRRFIRNRGVRLVEKRVP